MERTDLLEMVQRLGGFGRTEDAEAALTATLTALGAALSPNERRLLSAELPEALAGVLDGPERSPNMDLEAFYALVQRRENTRPGRAREHAQVVCRALSGLFPTEVLVHLRRDVPRLAPLFEPEEAVSPPEHPEVLHREPHPVTERETLATGRPGSRHPLSDARPETAHSESVVRSDEPHARTKLSSSRGLTQEREEESLATGKPPKPKRSLGD
jgi:uncharacterized protein (DUF2267 family)